MSEYDDLDRYDGDQRHDMWVDYSYYENTGELSDIFDDEEGDYDEEEDYEDSDYDDDDYDDYDDYDEEEEYY